MKIILIISIVLFKYSLHSNELIDLIGNDKYYKTKQDETLIDIARANNLAFPDIMSANKGLNDPWVVESEINLLLPKRHLLPKAGDAQRLLNKTKHSKRKNCAQGHGKRFSMAFGTVPKTHCSEFDVSSKLKMSL